MPNNLNILYPNGEVEAVQMFIWDGVKPILWDGSVTVTVNGGGGSIQDGVDPAIKASVVQSDDDPTKYGLVTLNPDGTNIGGGSGGGGAITSVIPGTGATNLGKAEDAVHTNGDVGVMSLAVRHDDNITSMIAADGDYIPITVNSAGRLKTSINPFQIIDDFTSTSGWTVLNSDAANLTTSVNHVLGNASISFDKVNGASNTPYAIIQKTISAVNLYTLACGAVFFQGNIWIPNTANTTNVIIRLGTDSSNYNEWAVQTTDLTAARWQQVRFAAIESVGVVGNGWDSTAVTYIAVGVQFDTEARLLAGILWDALAIVGGAVTDTVLQTSTQVNTANVNLNRINNVTPATSTGTVNTGSLRVSLATDVALPTGTNSIGGVKNSGLQNASWYTSHFPAANTVATITQASAGGSLKNVALGFTVTLAAGATAPTAIQLAVKLIDGASGGGTVLWGTVISLPAVAGAITSFNRTGRWVGTAATAMTLEFSAVGGANTIESVSLEGTTE